MPPRVVILLIVAFWLVTTVWLIYREVLPALQSGDSPPYSIDLADEVSAQTITWKVLKEGEEIGTVRTVVHRQPDRTFALEGDFKPRNLSILTVNVQNLLSRYVVTRGGDLRVIAIQLDVVAGGKAIKLGVDGKVVNGMFTPVIRVEGAGASAYPVPKLGAVAVAGHGNVLNPLNPLNRLKGLRAGQHWQQPIFDPLLVAVASLFATPPLRQLHAEVEPGMLVWNGSKEPCWKIDYRERSDKVAARTWVRREDGLVLQQEATHAGVELILQRDVTR